MSFLKLSVAALAVALHASSASAQSPPAGATPTKPSFELPTDPRLWHNSPPLSLESLTGKGVVFLFFEEESPRVAANWGNLQEMLKQYEGRPVLFVGVSSGTSPRDLKRYLGQFRVGVPVIHDINRTLENAMGVPKLEPGREEFALRYVAGDGSTGAGQGPDLATVAESALQGAAWRVDPTTIPPRLQAAWRAIELGDFSGPARALQQAAESNDEAVKAGAEKLLAGVESELTKAATAAADAIREGNDWTAYQRLEAITEVYGDYEFDLVGRAEIRLKELAKSDAVKDQIAANKLFEKAMETASGGGRGANRAKKMLTKITSDYPATEAAEKAQRLLASIER